jgi:hypothetical protein
MFRARAGFAGFGGRLGRGAFAGRAARCLAGLTPKTS